jgi:tetratricopeptide (TPR) repeat protein
MRPLLITAWLFVPLVAVAYHYGPGQDRLAMDHAQEQWTLGRELAAEGRHDEAIVAFDEALGHLPAEQLAEQRALRLEKAKSQMLSCGLPDAREALAVLLEEVEADPSADPGLVRETRLAMASAHFYTTWLMRLEGQPREVWEPEVDAARQHYRLLADGAESRSERAEREKDLAAAVRLARMELSELQGLPLPNQ